MTKLGLTGGMGSGKTTVARLLDVYGVPVFVADEAGKHLMDTSPQVREQLVALLGAAIYTPEGLDRRLVAARIFANDALLQQVNAVVHPAVYASFCAWESQQTAPVVALESAILFESNFHAHLHAVVGVAAPEALRLARIMARDGLSPAAIKQRLAHQLPDDARLQRCDYVVWNDNQQALIPQIEQLLTCVRQRNNR